MVFLISITFFSILFHNFFTNPLFIPSSPFFNIPLFNIVYYISSDLKAFEILPYFLIISSIISLILMLNQKLK